MSETNAQEPTMEEILASIRRIISEDDAPPAAPEETPHAAADIAPPPPPAAAEAPGASISEPPAPEEDDVLELTHPIPPSASVAPGAPSAPSPKPSSAGRETLGDLDVSAVKPAPARDVGLVSGQAASAAASSFSQLSRSIAMPTDGKTLEDVVTALLRPLLKDWLDQNLPSIVERKVQAEVERISRSQGA